MKQVMPKKNDMMVRPQIPNNNPQISYEYIMNTWVCL